MSFYSNFFKVNNQYLYRTPRIRATKKFLLHMALNPLLHIKNGKKPTSRGKNDLPEVHFFASFSLSFHSIRTKTRLQAHFGMLNNFVLLCRIAPGNLERVIAAKSAKIRKKANFWTEKVFFDPHFDFSQQNVTRHLFLYLPQGETCKISAKSCGSFRKSASPLLWALQ